MIVGMIACYNIGNQFAGESILQSMDTGVLPG